MNLSVFCNQHALDMHESDKKSNFATSIIKRQKKTAELRQPIYQSITANRFNYSIGVDSNFKIETSYAVFTVVFPSWSRFLYSLL